MCLSRDKYNTMCCLESEEVRNRITTDWKAAQVHVLPMMHLTFKVGAADSSSIKTCPISRGHVRLIHCTYCKSVYLNEFGISFNDTVLGEMDGKNKSFLKRSTDLLWKCLSCLNLFQIISIVISCCANTLFILLVV